MKFSHALKFNANSAWKDHYINYNRLKKLIYKKEAEETQGMSLNMPDIANRTSIGGTPSSSLLPPFQQSPEVVLAFCAIPSGEHQALHLSAQAGVTKLCRTTCCRLHAKQDPCRRHQHLLTFLTLHYDAW